MLRCTWCLPFLVLASKFRRCSRLVITPPLLGSFIRLVRYDSNAVRVFPPPPTHLITAVDPHSETLCTQQDREINPYKLKRSPWSRVALQNPPESSVAKRTLKLPQRGYNTMLDKCTRTKKRTPETDPSTPPSPARVKGGGVIFDFINLKDCDWRFQHCNYGSTYSVLIVTLSFHLIYGWQ